MMRWVLAALTTLAIVVGGWFLTQPDPPPPASAVAGVSNDALCLELTRAAFVMADGVRREFSRHRAAHRAYQAKKIPFGPVSNPKSVLGIWKTTMHKGAMHDRHYTELRGIMRAKGCLAGDGL